MMELLNCGTFQVYSESLDLEAELKETFGLSKFLVLYSFSCVVLFFFAHVNYV